jgi:hypothetical protein
MTGAGAGGLTGRSAAIAGTVTLANSAAIKRVRFMADPYVLVAGFHMNALSPSLLRMTGPINQKAVPCRGFDAR